MKITHIRKYFRSCYSKPNVLNWSDRCWQKPHWSQVVFDLAVVKIFIKERMKTIFRHFLENLQPHKKVDATAWDHPGFVYRKKLDIVDPVKIPKVPAYNRLFFSDDYVVENPDQTHCHDVQ